MGRAMAEMDSLFLGILDEEGLSTTEELTGLAKCDPASVRHWLEHARRHRYVLGTVGAVSASGETRQQPEWGLTDAGMERLFLVRATLSGADKLEDPQSKLMLLRALLPSGAKVLSGLGVAALAATPAGLAAIISTVFAPDDRLIVWLGVVWGLLVLGFVGGLVLFRATRDQLELWALVAVERERRNVGRLPRPRRPPSDSSDRLG